MTSQENTAQKKICNTCNISKELDLFSKAKLGKLGVTAICKKCANIKAVAKRAEKDHISTVIEANEKLINQSSTSMVYEGDLSKSVGVRTFLGLEERLLNLHQGHLDFTGAVYVNTHIPMKVICSKHGSVSIEPANMLQGQGCYQCGRDSTSNKLALNTKEFFNRIELIYPKGTYLYDKVQTVTNQDEQISVFCTHHQKYFTKSAGPHSRGEGCQKCATEQVGLQSRMPVERIIETAIQIHGDLYKYDRLTSETDTTKPLEIYCNRHKEYFFQSREKHLTRKAGCRQCAKFGFRIERPGTLYYLKVQKDNKVLYKIGITNRTVNERFRKDMQYITILQQHTFNMGLDAEIAEGKVLKQHKHLKYDGPSILKSGNTELFIKDIHEDIKQYFKEN